MEIIILLIITYLRAELARKAKVNMGSGHRNKGSLMKREKGVGNWGNR